MSRANFYHCHGPEGGVGVGTGFQRYCPSGSLAVAASFVNVVQDMLSACRSPKRALIRLRLFCVPPMASPPGLLVALLLLIPRTLTPGAAVPAVPWKFTVS